jgi:RIO kinase 1
MTDDSIVLSGDSFTKNTPRAPKPKWDDDEPDLGRSTYARADARGPAPVPDWLITEDAATEDELGLMKSGKEAEVYLVERNLGDRTNLLAAKRYRRADRRAFRNDVLYTDGRKTGNTRFDRAVAKGTRKGLQFRAVTWAAHEFDLLGRLWESGAPVPYPVQLLGTEVMLEYFGDDDAAAPRLEQARGSKAEVTDWYAQVVELLKLFTRAGIVHADLSAYNLLVWEGKVIAIDLPQAIDLHLHPSWFDVLHRDVVNVCTWFTRKGVECDPDTVFADVMTEAT